MAATQPARTFDARWKVIFSMPQTTSAQACIETEIAISLFPLDCYTCSLPRGSQHHESVQVLVLRTSSLRQGNNPARTGSRRSGIFGSPRITKNISVPHFWFSENSRKSCLEANLALFQPCKVPKARTAVLADQSLVRNGLSWRLSSFSCVPRDH